jgi:hypothetical protein
MRSEAFAETQRKTAAKADLGQPKSVRTRNQGALPSSHIIEVAGTRTKHFSDWLVVSSLFASSAERAVALRIRAIIDAYTVAFFKTYLQATPHPLLCVRHSPYPEVRFIESEDSEIESS